MGSFGAVLRRTREEKGITLDEIAGTTRLSKRYLLALEDEAIHKLPGGTYNRAYLRSYAGYLGLDIDRLVREYSLEEAHQTETGRLKAPLDVITSIGKAVESRGTSTAARRGWSVNWHGMVGRERLIALIGGLGLLAVVLLTGLIWVGLRGFRQEAAVPPSAAADGRSVRSEAVPPPLPALAPPKDEAPAPVVPKPVSPASRAGAAASPPAAPAAAAASAKARSTARVSRGRLSVTHSGVGIKIVDKRLVGVSDTFAVGTQVTFWTRVAGGRPGDTISHVWFHNGVRIGATSLRVGSSDWRTQSRQLLTPNGQWAVEARDADGRVLVRHRFHTARR